MSMRGNPSHSKHDLELKDHKKLYSCNGCMEKGFGRHYRCKTVMCDFDLHEVCKAPQILPSSHELFPGSTFKFYTTPPKPRPNKTRRYCDACMKPINGFVYHCEKHDVDLHPCCKNLPNSIRKNGVEFKLYNKVKGDCMRCKRKSLKDKGWSYISKCGGKEYHLHVACVAEMALIGYVNRGKTSEAQRRGNDENKTSWKILEILIENIVSIIIGDPTPIISLILNEFFAP